MSKIPQTNLKGKWQSSLTYITDNRSVSVYKEHLQTNKKMTPVETLQQKNDME